MKKSVRTIYGALLDTCKRFNDPLPILPNSTLNQKFDIFKNELPINDELPITQYVTIGLKGVDINLTTDGLYTTKYREYSPRWASLLGHVPFIMRPVEEGLTAAERVNFRLRRVETHNGRSYECWYARKVPLDEFPTGVEYRKLINGSISTSTWEPTLSDLNPTPITANPNQVLLTGDDYLAAVKRLKVVFTPVDVQEVMDCVNIIYGDPDKAIITEFGMLAGIDRILAGNFNGISQNYTEAIYAQITDFVKSTVNCPNALRGQTVYLDAGSNEPLLVVSN